MITCFQRKISTLPLKTISTTMTACTRARSVCNSRCKDSRDTGGAASGSSEFPGCAMRHLPGMREALVEPSCGFWFIDFNNASIFGLCLAYSAVSFAKAWITLRL